MTPEALEQLKAYVAEQLQAGANEAELRETIKKEGGWSDEDLAQVFPGRGGLINIPHLEAEPQTTITGQASIIPEQYPQKTFFLKKAWIYGLVISALVFVVSTVLVIQHFQRNEAKEQPEDTATSTDLNSMLGFESVTNSRTVVPNTTNLIYTIELFKDFTIRYPYATTFERSRSDPQADNIKMLSNGASISHVPIADIQTYIDQLNNIKDYRGELISPELVEKISTDDKDFIKLTYGGYCVEDDVCGSGSEEWYFIVGNDVFHFSQSIDYPKYNSDEDTVGVLSTISHEPPTDVDTSSYQTYVDSKYPFKFKHPSGLVVEPYLDYGVVPASNYKMPEYVYFRELPGGPKARSQITIEVIENRDNLDPKSWFESFQKGDFHFRKLSPADQIYDEQIVEKGALTRYDYGEFTWSNGASRMYHQIFIPNYILVVDFGPTIRFAEQEAILNSFTTDAPKKDFAVSDTSENEVTATGENKDMLGPNTQGENNNSEPALPPVEQADENVNDKGERCYSGELSPGDIWIDPCSGFDSVSHTPQSECEEQAKALVEKMTHDRNIAVAGTSVKDVKITLATYTDLPTELQQALPEITPSSFRAALPSPMYGNCWVVVKGVSTTNGVTTSSVGLMYQNPQAESGWGYSFFLEYPGICLKNFSDAYRRNVLDKNKPLYCDYPFID